MTQLDASLRNAPALITGFPGFLTSYLLEALFERQPEGDFTLVVQRKMLDEAQRRLDEKVESAGFKGTANLLIGDITDPKLGLDAAEYKKLTAKIGVVWHLAAIYDLAVSEKAAYRVNVSGTAHVLDFCEACKDFKRLNYISTCYVAGTRQGRIFEDELDEGQTFNNHYESTKFWAEVEVQRRMETIPTTILRPSIVVGHSKTGQTDKYDGPYYLLKAIKRTPQWMPFPNIGAGLTPVNIVPVDFAANAAAHLGLLADAEGQVFQLSDPNPMKAREIVALGLKCLEKPEAFGNVPPSLLGAVLKSEAVEELVGMPHQVVEYFTHDARYDATNATKLLGEAEITCPHLSDYMQVLVDYFERYPAKEFMDHRRV